MNPDAASADDRWSALEDTDLQDDPDGTRLHSLHEGGRTARALDLGGADLAGAHLDGLRGDGLRLVECDFSQGSFREVRLTSCDLGRARLTDATFADATIRMCSLDGARAEGATFDGARLEDSSIEGAGFDHADLRRSRLTETSWARTSLRKATLDEARGEGVVFRGADLSGACLRGVRLPDADFRGAVLTGADLRGGSFRRADFRGAILEDVGWDNTDRTGAIFDEGEPSGLNREPIERSEEVEGSPDAVASAVSDLVSSMVEAAAGGDVSPEDASGSLRAEWDAWRAQVERTDSARLRELVESLERKFDSSGVVPPDTLRFFDRLLRSLEAGEDDAPPEEWKAFIRDLFPEVDLEDEEALDRLASTLSALLGEQGRSGR